MPIKAFEKGKGITSEPLTKLEGKKCFNCHDYGYFEANCPKWIILSIREVKEIQAIEEEDSEE